MSDKNKKSKKTSITEPMSNCGNGSMSATDCKNNGSNSTNPSVENVKEYKKNK